MRIIATALLAVLSAAPAVAQHTATTGPPAGGEPVHTHRVELPLELVSRGEAQHIARVAALTEFTPVASTPGEVARLQHEVSVLTDRLDALERLIREVESAAAEPPPHTHDPEPAAAPEDPDRD